MQYLLLIYDNEKRYRQGYDKAELEQYRAFGKEFATAIKGGNALQPTSTAKTVRLRNGKSTISDWAFRRDQRATGRLLPGGGKRH